jgi:signal transduction histidine kinase
VNEFILLKLVTISASIFMAVAIYARDPGFRINRLMSGVVACTAWWAGCEAAWTLQRDPGVVIWLVRASSIGWLMVGPLFFDIFVELAGRHRSRFSRARSWVYMLSGLGMLIYIGTPWGLRGVVPTPWGWGFEFGSLFMVPFLIASIPPTLVLLSWRTLYPRAGSGGERSTSRVVFVGLAIAVVIASTTDAILPMIGIQFPPLGSTSIMLVSLAVAARLRRYGYSLLSAGAFAQEILAVLHDGVVLLRSDGRVRYCNYAFERLAGQDRDALMDRPISCILSGLPEDLEQIQRATVAEIGLEVRDPTPVLVSRPVVYRSGDQVLGAAVVVRDLREMLEIRQRLIRSARLAAVGDLSVGIAEEITRPIGAARNDLGQLGVQWRELRDVARKELRDDMQLRALLDEGEELIEESVEGVERISAIVRDVRGFAGSGRVQRTHIDVGELVESAIRIAALRAANDVVIRHEVEAMPDLIGVRSEIEQVLVNIIVNACHAAGNAGEVNVVAETSGDMAFIHVRDEGEGIEASILDRVFDPFFTTKPVGEGTGLGLAISYHIVRNHGGEIRVATRPGAGTTFTIELPLR